MKAGMLRVSTPSTQRTVADDRTYVVGRGRASDIVVVDSRVSRSHVALEPGPQGWLARDTSANGMWHDGRRVPTVAVDADVRLSLGAADGPEIVLSPQRRPAPAADPKIDEAATQLAPAGAAVPPAQRRRPDRAPAPAPAVAESGAQADATPTAASRWLRVIPTMLWLAATGFAVGALIALS